MRSYCKQITKHGQETMMFKCDQCGHEVAIDAYDMFVAEFNVFCPVIIVVGMKGAAMIYKRKARKSRKVGPEHRIQNDIIKILRLNHCNVMRANAGIIKTQNGSVFKGMENGTPDLIGFRWQDKQIFFIEVKSPTGRIRSDQLAYHSDLMHHKVIHGIARSVDDALKIVNEGLIGYGYPDTDKKEWY